MMTLEGMDMEKEYDIHSLRQMSAQFPVKRARSQLGPSMILLGCLNAASPILLLI